MKILISDAFDPSLPERLAPFGEIFDDKERLAEADVVLIRSKTKVTREYIDKAPNLKLVIRGGVGMDNVDKAYCHDKGITAVNTPEASSVAVAEMALALMLALPSRIVEAHNGIVGGKFLKKELKRTELYQKTLGLVGIGRIATEVAIRCSAFGMKIVAFDPYVSSSPHAEMKQTIDEVLAVADYLSLHTPLTDETKGMINAERIAKMKKGAVIVNTGRGKCILEDDVAAALKSGQLGGYASDVWYQDEIYGSPLVGAPNTVLAPHLGASSRENLLRIGDMVVDIVGKFASK